MGDQGSTAYVQRQRSAAPAEATAEFHAHPGFGVAAIVAQARFQCRPKEASQRSHVASTLQHHPQALVHKSKLTGSIPTDGASPTNGVRVRPAHGGHRLEYIAREQCLGRSPARCLGSQAIVPTENLIRTVRVTDRTDVGPANDGNVSIAAVHSVNVDEWLASFGRSSGRRAACTVFRRRPSMAVVRPRDDGSCGAGRPRAASP